MTLRMMKLRVGFPMRASLSPWPVLSSHLVKEARIDDLANLIELLLLIL